jgi:hypothetical protein
MNEMPPAAPLLSEERERERERERDLGRTDG